MSEETLDLGIPPVQALQLVAWVEAGMDHPCVSQYKHGDFLNDQGNGEFTADFFGFALVGKFGDPAVAFEQLKACDGDLVQLAALYEVDPNKIRDITLIIGNLQDFFDVGTKAIVAKIRNHYATSAKASPATPA